MDNPRKFLAEHLARKNAAEMSEASQKTTAAALKQELPPILKKELDTGLSKGLTTGLASTGKPANDYRKKAKIRSFRDQQTDRFRSCFE
jgi:hypothetical protein